MQNYEVQPGHQLILSGFPDGVLVAGDVIPEWAADRDNGLAGRVAVGCLAPTGRPVSVRLPGVVAKTADDPTPAIVAEAERQRAENVAYAASNRELGALKEGLTKEVANLTAALGKATADIAHLAAACEEHQAARDAAEKKITDLTAELEAATAPAA